MAFAAVALGAHAAVWACVPQPRLVTVHPRASGPPGAEVTVSVLGFDPGRAEIRWNAADGQLLATADGPDFSQRIAIPPSGEGLYHLVVLARAPGGEIGNTAVVAFQVTGAAPSPTTAPARSAGRPPTGAGLQAAAGEDRGPAGVALLAGGGFALLALGGLGGNALARRRRDAPTPR